MRALNLAILLLAPILAGAGCGRAPVQGAAEAKPSLRREVPPHGGTPVPLGEDYNLELVRDAESGTLFAYVLDDEMDEFVRSSSPSIAIAAEVDGKERELVLAAVANPATGETVGDTSLFEGGAAWLKTTGAFSGTVRRITIRGADFSGAKFDFPGGAETGPH